MRRRRSEQRSERSQQGGISPTWRNTELWKELRRRRSPESAKVKTAIERWLPDIETVLRAGGTSALDFTLHDSEHAYRVARRMAQLMPADVMRNLTAYELAFLLLSAYLHDVGMTPERKKVTSHYQFLLTGNVASLSSSETTDFQAFLDDHFGGVVPPVSSNLLKSEDLARANTIVAYYSRAKHNDWSAEWIIKYLSHDRLTFYSGWVNDLVTICRSHHEGYSDLLEPRFNPRIVASPGMVVHLRYLAVVLRVADILEFDPERTPDVILSHRDIAPSSLIYWHKDHQVSIAIDETRIVLAARPTTARFHRAIEAMADDIDRELSSARSLADETHFELCPGLTKKLKHRWIFMPAVHRQIEPQERRYEYIDGAFRPDTKKLLQLLSGVQLYGSVFDAVRELVSNAFDAVQMQIAHQRLALYGGEHPEKQNLLGNLHSVELTLENGTEAPCLVCRDSGIGMNKSIIRDRVLVSGTGAKHEVLALERRCREKGFQLGTTGQFGIGVLSYFMIANRLMLKTRRSVDAGDSEETGWSFETEGVGSFGELRRDPSIAHGTSVRLYLRPEIIAKGLGRFYNSVRTYLAQLLHHAPCQFTLSSTVPGCGTELRLKAGWVVDQKEYAKKALSQLAPRIRDERLDNLLPPSKRERVQTEASYWKIVRGEAKACLRWMVEEGELPHYLGKYRISMPYFELAGERVLAFLRVRETVSEDIRLERIGKGHVYIPEGSFAMSWRGLMFDEWSRRMMFRSRPNLDQDVYEEEVSYVESHEEVVRFEREIARFAFCDVNWESGEAGDVTVDRHGLVLSDKARSGLKWVVDRVSNMRRDILRNSESKCFFALNSRLVDNDTLPHSFELRWIRWREKQENTRWIRYEFPVSLGSLSGQDQIELFWNKRRVEFVDSLRREEEEHHYDGLDWNPECLAPDRIVVCPKVIAIYPAEFTEQLRPSERNLDWNIVGVPGQVCDVDLANAMGRIEFGIAPLWETNPRDRGATLSIVDSTCQFPPNWKSLCGVKFETYSGMTTYLWNPKHALFKYLDRDGWAWSQEKSNGHLMFGQKTFDPLGHKDEVLNSRSRAAAWVVRMIRDGKGEQWDLLKERDSSFLPQLWALLFGPEEAEKRASVCHWMENRGHCGLRVLNPDGWLTLTNWRDESSRFAQFLPRPSVEWSLRPREDVPLALR